MVSTFDFQYEGREFESQPGHLSFYFFPLKWLLSCHATLPTLISALQISIYLFTVSSLSLTHTGNNSNFSGTYNLSMKIPPNFETGPTKSLLDPPAPSYANAASTGMYSC